MNIFESTLDFTGKRSRGTKKATKIDTGKFSHSLLPRGIACSQKKRHISSAECRGRLVTSTYCALRCMHNRVTRTPD